MSLPSDDISPASTGAGFTFLGFQGGGWRKLAMKFLRRSEMTVKTVAATSYTLLPGDLDTVIWLSHASAITLTVPTQSLDDWPIGGKVQLIRGNTGQITVVGSGITLRTANSNRDNFNDVHSVCFVQRIGLAEWIFYGDTSAT